MRSILRNMWCERLCGQTFRHWKLLCMSQKMRQSQASLEGLCVTPGLAIPILVPRTGTTSVNNLPRAITQRRSDQQSTVWPTDHKSHAQHRCVTTWPTIHGGPQKWNHKLMAIILCEILTDYQKFYTGKVAGKFAVKWLLKIPPCLAYIATQPN